MVKHTVKTHKRRTESGKVTSVREHSSSHKGSKARYSKLAPKGSGVAGQNRKLEYLERRPNFEEPNQGMEYSQIKKKASQGHPDHAYSKSKAGKMYRDKMGLCLSKGRLISKGK